MRYNIYETIEGTMAIEDGSEFDPTADGAILIAERVSALPATRFSPQSSAFQSRSTDEYIDTGLPYPHSTAVLVR